MVVRDVREGQGRAFLEVLEALCQGARGTPETTVQVLAAADHDGVCSSLVLSKVLRHAGVKFIIDPVGGNDAILEQLRALEPAIRSVVLLNCGASLDLQRELELCGASAGVRCFLIDCHRPLLLANLSGRHDRVFVLDHDTDEIAGSRPPRPEPDVDPAGPEGGSDDDAPSGGEEEWDPTLALLNPAERAARRAERTLARHERRRQRAEEQQARADERRRQLSDYYQESYYAVPVAISLYRMAAQLSCEMSHELLWLAAVSLAGYHDLGLISDIEYDVIACNYLKEEFDLADVAHTAPSQPSQRGGRPDEEMALDGEDMTPARPPMPARLRRDRRSLRFEGDLRLTLYRHWTLEESVAHSPHFYKAFELHRERGTRLLKRFFAEAGITPNQYQQYYGGMQIPIRKTIQKRFREHGKRYSLTESAMFLDQFVRNQGPCDEGSQTLFLHELSCSDAAHVLLAHLSAVPASLSGGSVEKLPTTADGHRDLAAVQQMERDAMIDNFWRASEAVLNSEAGPRREGMALAVEVARAVRNVAKMIVDTKATRKCPRFRYCRVEQPGHVFRHSLSVRRLAVWLLRVFFSDSARAREDREMPCLMIMHDRVRETYLCVGATPKRGPGDGDYFGSIFRSALRADPSMKFAYDFFDKSCIEIAVDDFGRFMSLITTAA